MKQFVKSKLNILSIITLTFLTLIISTIYIQFDNKTKDLKNDILQNEIYKASEYASNISYMILSKVMDENLYEFLKENQSVKNEMDEKLALFKSSKYLNIFVIRKDKKDKLRYLLDAEGNIEEKGFFDQKFDPQSKLWYKVFDSSVAQYAVQDNIEELWITFLHPININGKTQAVLAFDFSSNEHTYIVNMITPIKNIFLFLSLVLVVFLIFSYSQLYLNYKIEKKGLIDPLTLSYNRLYLNTLKNKINLAKYELCMVDIDYFKKINDTYGHSTGDIVLKSFSKRILNQIKKDDILIRYGGEEFLLLIKKRDEETSSCIIPERIRQVLENSPIAVDDKIIYVTASFGVNNKPNQSPSLNEAIKIADEQLYKAKNTGRNKVVCTHIKNPTL